MGETPVTEAQRLLAAALETLGAAAVTAGDAEALSVLTVCETATRALDRVAVATIDRLAYPAGDLFRARLQDAGRGTG